MWNFVRKLLGVRTNEEAARLEGNLKAMDEKNADLEKIQEQLRSLSQAATKGRAHYNALSKHHYRPVILEDLEQHGEPERIENPVEGPGVYRGEQPASSLKSGPKGGKSG